MKPISSRALAAVVLLIGLSVAAVPAWQRLKSAPPDFESYPAGDARKTAFFSYFGPLIDAENERRRLRRERLLALKAGAASKRDRLWLDELATFFEIPEGLGHTPRIDALLVHVGQVPRSLALAQAAKESAWGTSRFAVEGNNYFGQRCYIKGCGMIPANRPRGANFEVRKFDSPAASVESYMNNINSHPDYEPFRAYRVEQRVSGRPIRGIEAAEQLTQYSERRQDYVNEIQSLIRFNRLEAH
jgi:Bax protein